MMLQTDMILQTNKYYRQINTIDKYIIAGKCKTID